MSVLFDLNCCLLTIFSPFSLRPLNFEFYVPDNGMHYLHCCNNYLPLGHNLHSHCILYLESFCIWVTVTLKPHLVVSVSTCLILPKHWLLSSLNSLFISPRFSLPWAYPRFIMTNIYNNIIKNLNFKHPSDNHFCLFISLFLDGKSNSSLAPSPDLIMSLFSFTPLFPSFHSSPAYTF